MSAVTVPFAEIEPDLREIISDILYATMTTVDTKGRPRSRVLLPIWEMVDGRPLGWLATYRTPTKVAHLAGNPHATFSYWSPAQHTVSLDTVAEWVTDQQVKNEVWELYRRGSPRGVGYDPKRFWKGGPTDPKFQLLKMVPWRVQVLRAEELTAGRPFRIWRS